MRMKSRAETKRVDMKMEREKSEKATFQVRS